MTSDRPYQGPVPIAEAVAEIVRCAGSQFDPEVSAALERIYDGTDDATPPIELLAGITRDDQDAAAPADPFARPATISLRDR
jgi:hypothetical protein